MFVFTILQAVIITASFLKMMNFLKVDANFGLLVDSVGQCLADCVPFSTFLSAWMALFGILYRVLGMTIPEGDYGTSTDKNLMNSFAVFAL